MQQRHLDRNQYFDEQAATTEKYVIPYIEQVVGINADTSVLEVGCGEGGNLLPFAKIGCKCYGIDFSQHKIEVGKQNLPNVTFICNDIYRMSPSDFPKFNIIFLRDVIEHIHNQGKFIGFIKQFLAPNGIIFFAFPPWQMPFGGHQQIAKNKILSALPYYHLLPTKLYRFILKKGNSTNSLIDNLLEIKQTGISIERFNKALKINDFRILQQKNWFINPNYEIKFGLKPRKLLVLNNIPYLRNFFTTCLYCIASPIK